MHADEFLLAAAERGEISWERVAEILCDHLRLVCKDCRKPIEAHAADRRGGPSPRPVLRGTAVERLGSRRELSNFRTEVRSASAWVREIVRLEPGKRRGRIRGAYTRFRGPVFGTLLLEEARRAIPANPDESLSLAEAALLSCQESNPEKPDPEIRAAALAVAGNAKRALGRLKEAEEDLAKARKLLDKPGMRDPVLHAEVERYLGGLRKDQGSLEQAAGHLEWAGTLYSWLGDRPAAARVLLKLGTVEFRRQQFDAALAVVDRVLEFCSTESEIRIETSAHFNRAYYLHARGDLDAAEAELEAQGGRLEKEGAWGRQHLVWLRARIAWSRGDLEAAERLYSEARIAFDTSLVDLELCLVDLAQGRTARVKTLATEALEVFAEQEVEHEVRAALALVVEAARREALTRELIERAIATLERSGRR
jgi:tetratricopeptide (TPR) repeat protein